MKINSVELSRIHEVKNKNLLGAESIDDLVLKLKEMNYLFTTLPITIDGRETVVSSVDFEFAPLAYFVTEHDEEIAVCLTILNNEKKILLVNFDKNNELHCSVKEALEKYPNNDELLEILNFFF